MVFLKRNKTALSHTFIHFDKYYFSQDGYRNPRVVSDLNRGQEYRHKFKREKCFVFNST